MMETLFSRILLFNVPSARTAATKVVATATVRAGNRRMLPTRAALVLVSRNAQFVSVPEMMQVSLFQTPSATNRIKMLLDGKPEYVSH